MNFVKRVYAWLFSPVFTEGQLIKIENVLKTVANSQDDGVYYFLCIMMQGTPKKLSRIRNLGIYGFENEYLIYEWRSSIHPFCMTGSTFEEHLTAKINMVVAYREHLYGK